MKEVNYSIALGELFNWIKNYLSNRTEKFIVAVTSEVPQGTALGPLFFLVYINDLPDSIKSQIGLLVDDSIVYNNIISITGWKILQSDLDALRLWPKNWDMEFNANKWKMLTIANRKI